MNKPYFDSNSENLPEEEYTDNQDYGSLKERKPLPSIWFILPVLLAGIALVVIIAVWFRGKNQSPPVSLTNLRLEDRVSAIENRLAVLNGIEDRLQALERDHKAYLQAAEKFNQMESTLTQRMDQLNRSIASVSAKPPAEKSATTKASPKTAKQAYAVTHVVKSGDTLYGISRRYQVSINQLRADNNLGKKSILQPGQKLTINPPAVN